MKVFTRKKRRSSSSKLKHQFSFPNDNLKENKFGLCLGSGFALPFRDIQIHNRPAAKIIDLLDSVVALATMPRGKICGK